MRRSFGRIGRSTTLSSSDCPAARRVTAEFSPERVRSTADVSFGRLGFGQARVVGRDVRQHEGDDLLVAPTAGEIAAFAADLPEHVRLLSATTVDSNPRSAEVGHDSDNGRLGRACNSAGPSLSSSPAAGSTTCCRAGRAACCSPIWRCPDCSQSPASTLIDALWGEAAARQRRRCAQCADLQDEVGRRGLSCSGAFGSAWTLPEPARVDIEVAQSTLHAAESAVAVGEWRRAWAPALSALFIARRTFLPEAETSWAEAWRRRLEDVRVRALECYAQTCLELGGTELPGAERAGRELVEVAPLRESGHLLLMRTLAARGNLAEALAAYERLRVLLRDELGVEPRPPVQDEYIRLLVIRRQDFAKASSRPPQSWRRMLRLMTTTTRPTTTSSLWTS